MMFPVINWWRLIKKIIHYLILKYLKLFIVQKILIQKQKIDKHFLHTDLNILTLRYRIIKFCITFMNFLVK
jgi:hypothetical protein